MAKQLYWKIHRIKWNWLLIGLLKSSELVVSEIIRRTAYSAIRGVSSQAGFFWLHAGLNSAAVLLATCIIIPLKTQPWWGGGSCTGCKNNKNESPAVVWCHPQIISLCPRYPPLLQKQTPNRLRAQLLIQESLPIKAFSFSRNIYIGVRSWQLIFNQDHILTCWIQWCRSRIDVKENSLELDHFADRIWNKQTTKDFVRTSLDRNWH